MTDRDRIVTRFSFATGLPPHEVDAMLSSVIDAYNDKEQENG